MTRDRLEMDAWLHAFVLYDSPISAQVWTEALGFGARPNLQWCRWGPTMIWGKGEGNAGFINFNNSEVYGFAGVRFLGSEAR